MRRVVLPDVPRPTNEQIDTFYKDWWKENYMQPLNKTPMGLIDFMQDFYDRYCVSETPSNSDT